MARGKASPNWTLEIGPFRGVYDSDEPEAADPREYLGYAANGWIRPGLRDVGRGGWETRPARNQTVAARSGVCRGVGTFTKGDGTTFPVGVFDTGGAAEVIRLDNGTVMTPTVTTIIAGTGPVYMVAFAQGLVFSDGTNPPFWWDGIAASAGTVIRMDGGVSTIPAYGAPWVYNSQLFFIRGDDKRVINWSDVNLPTLGYNQAPTYTNTWVLTQTSGDWLTAGIGTNTEMFIFRTRSVTRITGSQNSQYQTSGTFEGVSDHVGSPQSGLQVRVDANVYFLDLFNRLHVIEPGPRVRPLWEPARKALEQSGGHSGALTAQSAQKPFTLTYWPAGDVLLHHDLWNQYAGANTYGIMVWDRTGERYYGKWLDGGSLAYADGISTTNRQQGAQAFGVAGYGVLYTILTDHSVVSQSNVLLAFPSGFGLATDVGFGVYTAVRTRRLGWDATHERLFNRATLAVMFDNGGLTSPAFAILNIGVATDRDTGGGTQVFLPAGSGGAPAISLLRYAPSQRGRWVQYEYRSGYVGVNTPGPAWRLLSITYEGTVAAIGDPHIGPTGFTQF